MAEQKLYDIGISGGGPAGTVLASYLARAGLSVVLFERQSFPRHQIGESLLPFSLEVLQDIGLSARELPFIKKHGATFHSERSLLQQRFSFKDSLNPAQTYAYSVERSEFDQFLLNHAIRQGVEVRQPVAVDELVAVESGFTVNGSTRCRFFAHATGQAHRKKAPELYTTNRPEDRLSALFAYYPSRLSPQESNFGDVLINLFYDDQCPRPQWGWVIPISHKVLSMGFVVNSEQFKSQMKSVQNHQSLMDAFLAKNTFYQPLLHSKTPLDGIHFRHDFQRIPKQITFDRQLLVGDAAGFIDPVFSSGVHLAFTSAKLAAASIIKCFETEDFSALSLRGYEIQYRRKFWYYYRFVKAFYQKNIVEKIFLPAGNQLQRSSFEDKARQFTSILAGDSETHNPLLEVIQKRRGTLVSGSLKE